MPKNIEKENRRRLPPDHPALKRFLGWLQAVETLATPVPPNPSQETPE